MGPTKGSTQSHNLYREMNRPFLRAESTYEMNLWLLIATCTGVRNCRTLGKCGATALSVLSLLSQPPLVHVRGLKASEFAGVVAILTTAICSD